METNEAGGEALVETTVLLQYFKDMPGDRQAGKGVHPRDEIVLLSPPGRGRGEGHRRHRLFARTSSCFCRASAFVGWKSLDLI